MRFRLLRHNQRAVDRALTAGEYDAVLNASTQRLDEFVGLMQATGLFDLLALLAPPSRSGDVPEEMLLRELAVLPVLDIPNVHQAGRFLLQDPAVLRFLGFTVEQVTDGFPHRPASGSPAEMRAALRRARVAALVGARLREPASPCALARKRSGEPRRAAQEPAVSPHARPLGLAWLRGDGLQLYLSTYGIERLLLRRAGDADPQPGAYCLGYHRSTRPGAVGSRAASATDAR